MLIWLFSLASPLRDSRKDFSLLQAPCETPGRIFLSCKPLARLPEGFFSFASPLRDSRKVFSSLQAPCETPGRIILVCKPLVRLPEGFFSFASLLRDTRKDFSRLQAPCETKIIPGDFSGGGRELFLWCWRVISFYQC